MSARATGWALAQKLPPVTKLVLVALADEVRRDGTTCFPARRTLADDVGIKPRALSNHLADLEERGLLLRQDRFRENGSRTSTLYHLAIDGKLGPPCTTMQGGVLHDGAGALGTEMQGPLAPAGATPEPGSEPGSEQPSLEGSLGRTLPHGPIPNAELDVWVHRWLPDEGAVFAMQAVWRLQLVRRQNGNKPITPECVRELLKKQGRDAKSIAAERAAA